MIIFIMLILIFGTDQLPVISKKIGVWIREYNKTKKDLQDKLNDVSNQTINVKSPVSNNRQKLETIAKSLDIDFKNKSYDELKRAVSSTIESK